MMRLLLEMDHRTEVDVSDWNEWKECGIYVFYQVNANNASISVYGCEFHNVHGSFQVIATIN